MKIETIQCDFCTVVIAGDDIYQYNVTMDEHDKLFVKGGESCKDLLKTALRDAYLQVKADRTP